MLRTALCAVLALLVTAPAADAGPPKVRTCAADPRGDVRLNDSGPFVDAPHLDLATAGVGVSSSVATVVIRTYDTGGHGRWKATFGLGDARLFAVAYSSPVNGTQFVAGRVGEPPVGALGRFDVAKKEIRIAVPRKLLRATGRAHATLSGTLAVEATQTVVATGSAAVYLVDRWTC